MSRADQYGRRGFWAFILTQTQGAFSDNLYKVIVYFFVPTLIGAEFPTTALATALFNLPWLLVPAIAGALSDRLSKRHVMIGAKVWEVGVMLFAGVAVMLQNPYMLFGIVFLMSMQSAFFSPAKYGYLPETLPESKLSWGNGILQMMTFLAIILGMAAAGWLINTAKEGLLLMSSVLVLFSVAGLVTSFFITRVPPASPERRIPINPYRGLGRHFRAFREEGLVTTVTGLAFFWFAGTLLTQNVVELGKIRGEMSLLLVVLSVGIGIGSVAAGYVSRGKVELGLTPLGLVGILVLSLLLGLLGLDPNTLLYARVVTAFLQLPDFGALALWSCLAGLGFAAGFFNVPLAANLQRATPPGRRGGMIAASNAIQFAGMLMAPGLFYLLFNRAGFGPGHIFLVNAGFCVLIGGFMMAMDRRILLRTVLWLLNGVVYKLRVFGKENLPDRGGVLVVGNHMSILDTLAITASTGRPLRFVMDKSVFDCGWTARIARRMGIIAIDAADGAGAAEAIRAALRKGEAVCINQERRYVPEGEDMPWHEDYHALVEGIGAPIVPLHLSRLWQRLYYFENLKLVWRGRERRRYPARVVYGAPVAAGDDGIAVRRSIQKLGMDSYEARAHRFRLLHHAFIRMARKCPRTLAIADAMSGSMSYFKALVGSIVFARKLKALLDDNENVGVLLPPSVGGALTNIALQMLGKVAVNLNYSVSSSVVASCARQAGLTQVITAQRFLDAVNIEVPGEALLLEDVKKSVGGKDRIIAMLMAIFFPVGLLDRVLGRAGRSENDLATIIFSSGSEGEPKGVMLTHRNIMGNVEAAFEVFPHNRHSSIMGFLPFFHSFGYMATLWLPLCNGVGGIYHPNPLEPKAIGDLIQKYQVTIMLGSSTLLQGFIRRCTPEQLASIVFVVTGAEKLAPRVRLAFLEKFGVEPLEGYGTTECAPVVSLNAPDCHSPGFFVQATIHGSIGRPIPGLGTRVVDPDTEDELPIGDAGLLQVRGVNIMQGYLHQEEKTASVLKDRWYSTGDIAKLDGDGFITITDRLSRFSKIAGEMVPHNRVEETMHSLLGLTEQALAVASVPDKTRGERLVVVHTLEDDQLAELHGKLGGCDLPNLWIPRQSAFHRIEAIPVLGTGKMDIKTVKQLAHELEGVE